MSNFLDRWANEPFPGIRAYNIRRRCSEAPEELYRVQADEYDEPAFEGGAIRRIVCHGPSLKTAEDEAVRRILSNEWENG